MVDITFPNSNPTYCGTSLTLSCPATVRLVPQYVGLLFGNDILWH